MQSRLLVGIVGLGFIAMMAFTALAANPHVVEAIKHAKVAVAQGQANYPDELIKHAEEALAHAEMAKKETSSPHLDEGLTLLSDAVTEAGNGYLNEAVDAAESAIEHFSKIQ